MNCSNSPLVILMGSPRSGTSWLAKIIDSHPSVLYRHEPDSINVRPDIPFVPDSQNLELHFDACRDYLELLKDERASKSAGSQPMFRKEYRGAPTENLRRFMIFALKVAERILGENSVVTDFQIPDMIPARKRREVVYFIKSVSSLCRTSMFSQAVSDIKFVHVLRHPCAYVASTIRGKKLGLLSDDPYIETLANMGGAKKLGLTLERLKSMSREEQLAARWMLQNSKVMEEMAGKTNFEQVIYEDLCNDPMAVTRSLFEYLGLDLGDQTRDFLQKSSASTSKQPRYFDVNRNSSEAAVSWMKELSDQQIESVRRVVSSSEAGKKYFPE